MMNLRKSPRLRAVLSILLPILLAALLLAANLGLPLAMQRGALYIDMTPEGLYTLSRAMNEELAELETEVELIFCADPDYLMANEETRMVYVMAKKLAKRHPFVSLRHIDPQNDPAAADPYKQSATASIAWNDLIVSCGKQYKIYSASAFFGMENGKNVTFNGEYRLASIILSLTAHPTGAYAYFAAGHGERFYVEGNEKSDPELSAFASQLASLGIGTRTIDLDTEEIPEDCVLLVFCGTTEDYSRGDRYDLSVRSPIEKLDEYLCENRSAMVLRDALGSPCPTFDEYLAEWGFAIGRDLVSAPDSSLGSGNRLIATYPTNEEGGGEIGYSMISAIADLASPPKMIFENAASIRLTRDDPLLSVAQNVSRIVDPFFFAGIDAKITDKNGLTVEREGSVWLAALAMEARLQDNGEYRYTYLLGSGTTAIISNEYLNDSAFGNADVMFSILRTITRTDRYASSALGGLDISSENYGGKAFTDTKIYPESYEIYTAPGKSYTVLGLTAGRTVFCVALVSLTVLAVPVCAFVVLRRRKSR